MEEGPSLPFAQRMTRRQWVAFDASLAALLTTAMILATALGARQHPYGVGWDAIRYVATVIACFALPVRQWSPMFALCLVEPANVALISLLGGVVGPSLIIVAAVVYTVAATEDRRRSLKAALAVVAGLVLGALFAAGGPAWASAVSLPFIVFVGWLAGENTRARRAYAQELVERAVERERERADRALRAVSDERLRIARDLHDIVAHTMSVIAIRSGVARMVIDTQPSEAREALGIIETTSRHALSEMRLMVGVLRQSEDGAALGPAPGLADLPELISQIGEAGVEIDLDLDVDVEPQTLPAGVDLSAYRIIQEALTNVARHAGPTTAHVAVRHRGDHLEIEVVDQGSRPGWRSALTSAGQGHGLIGMLERVGLFGGQLSAVPYGGGFRVLADLPFEEETR